MVWTTLISLNTLSGGHYSVAEKTANGVLKFSGLALLMNVAKEKGPCLHFGRIYNDCHNGTKLNAASDCSRRSAHVTLDGMTAGGPDEGDEFMGSGYAVV